MFIEISKEKFLKLKTYLDEKKIKYDISDATRVWDKKQMLHIEIPEISEKEIYEINEKIDDIHNEYYIKEKGIVSEKLQKEIAEELEFEREEQRRRDKEEEKEEEKGLFG